MFYDDLPQHRRFEDLANQDLFTPLPDDWVIGTSDIIGSTQHVQAGRYKTVNMVGAAVISAQINAHKPQSFPFVFGGDGAAFAVPEAHASAAAAALQATQSWADREFDVRLRTALTPMADIRAAGHDVTVARYRVSDGVDYAMFSGGGVTWAEDEMKAGRIGLPPAAPDAQPDLTGLSCRWSHMPAQRGQIVSIVVVPAGTGGPAYASAVQEVLHLAQSLERGGHPAPQIGPGVKWPPAGAALEAHAQRKDGSLNAARRVALFESFVAWALIKTGLKIAGFDARRYRRVVGDNADFRKFDDGLKMTLDCDSDTAKQLRDRLDQAQKAGSLRYGWHAQDEAMMTCIVPAIDRDDHVHFVDGAGGGYTQAASNMKAGLS